MPATALAVVVVGGEALVAGVTVSARSMAQNFFSRSQDARRNAGVVDALFSKPRFFVWQSGRYMTSVLLPGYILFCSSAGIDCVLILAKHSNLHIIKE